MAADTNLVVTPVGMLRKQCVHLIPKGERVDENNNVTRVDGSTYAIPKCTEMIADPWLPQVGPRTLPVPRRRGGAFPGYNGWVKYAYVLAASGYRELDADFVVPNAPTLGAGATYFAFPGLQDSNYVIQPVLTYDQARDSDGFAYGGDFWSLANWKCNTGSDCYYSTPIGVSVGDVIHSTITASSCASNSCTWTIYAKDNNTAQTTTHVVTGTDSYTFAAGGVIEMKDFGGCDQLAQPKINFSSIALYDHSHTQVTPSWTIHSDSLAPSCNYAQTYSSSAVEFDALSSTLNVVDAAQGLIQSAGTHSVGVATETSWSPATAFYYTWMVQYCSASPCSYGNATDGSHTTFASGVGVNSESMSFDSTDYQRDVIVVIQEYTGGTGRSGWVNHLFSGPTF
jgi:hypothetical protein